MGSLSNRVEEILKAQNSLVADSGVEMAIPLDLAANTVTFSAYAVPKTYVEGMTVEFVPENGGLPATAVQCGEDRRPTEAFSAALSIALTDHIDLSALMCRRTAPARPSCWSAMRACTAPLCPSLRLNSFPEKLRITADGFTPQEA